MSSPDPASTKTFTPVGDERAQPKPATHVIGLSLGCALLMAVPAIPDKLQLGTVLCLGFFPFLLKGASRNLRVRLLIATSILWLVGQIVADQVNGLGLGRSLPILLSVTIVTTTTSLLHFARGDFERLRLLILGVAGGGILSMSVLEPVPIFSPETWKFGLNLPVAIALLSWTDLAWRRGKRIPSFLALAAICGLGLWSDTRGISGIAVLAALFLLLTHGRRRGYPIIVFLAGGTALLLVAFSILQVDSAQSSLIGERSAEQVRRFGANPLSILVNVRPELFQELGLFLQRPFTGFGSVPALSTSEYMKSIELLHAVGVTDTNNLSNTWLGFRPPGVSAHSMAADSLVRAGVAAAPFWILVVLLALSAGAAALQFRSSPLVVMWTMLVLWDTFFSPLTVPFGPILLAAYLALCCGDLPEDAVRGGHVP